MKNSFLLAVFILFHVLTNAQTAQDHYIKGIQSMDEHKYNTAIANFTKALDADNNFSEAYLKRGACLLILNDIPNALVDLDKAIEINPKNAVAYYNRGLIKKQQNEYDAAIEDFSLSIALKKEFGIAYFNRALCKLALSDFENACSDLAKAADLKVENAAEIYTYTCKKP